MTDDIDIFLDTPSLIADFDRETDATNGALGTLIEQRVVLVDLNTTLQANANVTAAIKTAATARLIQLRDDIQAFAAGL